MSSSESEIDIKSERRSPKKFQKFDTTEPNNNQSRDDFERPQMLESYLQKNETIKLANKSKHSNVYDDLNVSEDDEIWLVQCPKSTNLNELVGRKIKLSDQKSTVLNTEAHTLELNAEILKKDKFLTILGRTRRDDGIMALSLPQKGLIKINTDTSIVNENVIDFDSFKDDKILPYPSNLKIRHPIHGIDFLEKSVLNETTRNKLNKAVSEARHYKGLSSIKKEKGLESTTKPRIKNEHNDEDDFIITKKEAIPDDDDQHSVIENFTEKKSKKKSKKRPREESDDNKTSPPHKPKKSRPVKVEDDTLDWLSNI